MPRCGWSDPANHAGAAVVVPGASSDGATSHRSGTRFGPQHLRRSRYLPQDGSRPSPALRVDGPAGLAVHGARDVETSSGDAERPVDDLQAAVYAIAAVGAAPLVLGGDHTIAWPDAAGVAQHVGRVAMAVAATVWAPPAARRPPTHRFRMGHTDCDRCAGHRTGVPAARQGAR